MSCTCGNCSSEDNPLGWIVLTPSPALQVQSEAVHAVPDNDVHPHGLDDDGQCACKPWLDDEADGLLWVHNAFDGREAFARGFRKPS